MLVSATEKNAERTSNTASVTSWVDKNAPDKGNPKAQERTSQYSGRFEGCQGIVTDSRAAAAENHLQYESAANVGKKQGDESGEDPADGGAPSPTVVPPAHEKRGKNNPGGNREDRLMVKPHRATKNLFRKGESCCKRCREQDESDRDDSKQHALECEQWWQRCEGRGQRTAVQASFQHGHEKRLQGGNREKAVRPHRQNEVYPEHRRIGMRLRCEAREDSWKNDAHPGKREDKKLEAIQAYEKVLNPVDRHTKPEHDRKGLPESESQLRFGEYARVQQPAVRSERDQDRESAEGQIAVVGCRNRSPIRAPEKSGQEKIGERSNDVKRADVHFSVAWRATNDEPSETRLGSRMRSDGHGAIGMQIVADRKTPRIGMRTDILFPFQTCRRTPTSASDCELTHAR